MQPRVTKISELTVQMLIWIGVFQMLALIPGTSRSGATIVGALMIGISRGVAAEFTFFLAIPVMFGASFLKILGFRALIYGEGGGHAASWLRRILRCVHRGDQSSSWDTSSSMTLRSSAITGLFWARSSLSLRSCS